VYGGAISMKIGAYARSQIGFGYSYATCEATVCDNCSVSLSHVIVAGSSAVSEAAGGSSRGAFVYGGSVAVVFGAQLWSSSSFRGLSRVIVKESNVSGLQLTLSHCSITGSVAATSIIGGQLSSASSAGSEALGGGVAVVVGSLVFSSVGPFGTLNTSVSGSYVRSSGILLAQNRFSDCTVTSSNECAGSGSLGSSSVYGGALAVIQSPQMSIFNNGLLSPESAAASSGYDFMVSVSDSNFSSCSAAAFSALACPNIPGSTSGGGGAVYVRGVALSRFSVDNCIFKSSNVSVACGTTGLVFRSTGGALAVEAAGSSRTVVAVSKCSFIHCAAIGASPGILVVRGGAMSVADAEVVWVEDSQFVNCSITNAVKSYNPSNKLQLVNGGAGASISFALNVSVLRCIFDSAGYTDQSDVSAGLLVLFSGPSAARVLVCDTVLNASQVVLRVGCTNKTNHAPAECSPSAVQLSIVNSSISQKAPFPPRDDFDLVGSALLALHDGVTPLFDRCRMKCAKADFAVFKNKTDELSIVQHECKPCPPFELAVHPMRCSLTVLLMRLVSTAAFLQTLVQAALSVFQSARLSSTCRRGFGLASSPQAQRR